MKKQFFLLTFFFLFLFGAVQNISAQNIMNHSDPTVQQIIIPKEIYVGDTANLKFNFRTNIDLYAFADKVPVKNDVITIDVEDENFTSFCENCTLKKLEIIRNGLNYSIDIVFIPWVTGEIDFETIDLMKYLCNGEEMHFYIDFIPFTISSLSESLGVSSLKPPAPPFTVPGTNYWIWSLVIAIIIILILAGMLSARMPKIIAAYERWKKHAGYSRNARSAVVSLTKLIKRKNLEDSMFAEYWQKIVRRYLNYRFNHSFNSVPSSKISESIRNITGDMLSTEQEIALMSLSQIFIRTDYIRFAKDSIDSKQLPVEEHKALFVENEKEKLIQKTEKFISVLEKEPEEVPF